MSGFEFNIQARFSPFANPHSASPTESTQLKPFSASSANRIKLGSSKSVAWTGLLIVVASLSLNLANQSSVYANPIVATQDADQQAYRQADMATNAQNAPDYPMAANAWKKLINDFPDSEPAKKIAQRNLGICLMELKQYSGAIDAFQKAIPVLQADKSPRLAEAQLSLGFCLYRHGIELALVDTADAKEKSQIEFTTATQAFERVLVEQKDYEDADQAAYFQGQAYRALDRLEEAAASYEKMLTFEKQYFKFNGIYFLADVYERLGQYDKAITQYQSFRELAKEAGGHELLDDANFAYAETLMNLGVAQTKRGETAKAELSYETADEVLDAVNLNDTYKLRDKAIFKQGLCAEVLKEHGRASTLYSEVAMMDSTLKDRATVFAGRNFILDGKPDEGTKWLDKAIASDSSYAIDAVHLLASNLLTNKNQPQAAFELVEKWIGKADGHPLEVELLMDRADASWAEEKLRDRSAKLYQDIATNHPQHQLAPQALYGAAFALKSDKQYVEAIKLADKFAADYPDHDFRSDAADVKAEALLLSKSYSESEAAFRQLVRDHSENDRAPFWIIRAANASYLQDNFKPTIDWLDSNLAAINSSALQAEAFHLIGSSHLKLDQYDPAVTNLNKSLNLDSEWSRVDETMLNLSLAQSASGDMPACQATVKTLAERFPKSDYAAEGHYRLAEYAYKSDESKTATENYDAIISNFPESELVPYALSGAGWTALKAGDNALADQRFSTLIEKYPDDELVTNAKSGRGVARRNEGSIGESIVDLKSAMESAQPGLKKTNAQYELGLAYVQDGNWDEAITTFKTLIDTAPDSALADKFHYELAWAYHEKKDAAKELELFTAIADKFPNSEFAPEANFFLGTGTYDKGEFKESIEFFSKAAADKSNDEVREKSAYKLGWAHYQLKEYDEALASFKNQTDSFPEGELFADGLFMVGQSHFGSKNYEEALKAYTAAKPIIESSDNVGANIKMVMLLNAAQAANSIKSYDDAITMATPLTEMDMVDKALKQDAWLEIGIANGAKGNYDGAIKAYELASANLGKTGAQAQCLRGDVFFKQAADAAKADNMDESKKKFDEAIQAFKLVYYGYGGPKASDAVRPWQAYAAYEAARCNVSQVNSAKAEMKERLIDEGIKHFEYLLKFYPEDRLAPEAKKQLASLKKLKQ